MKFTSLSSLLIVVVFLPQTWACDLCAISSANSARGESKAGFLFSASELYTPYRTVQLDGEELTGSILNDVFLDSSITHLAPGYNFSRRFGVSVNVPVIHRRFERLELTPTGFVRERGAESGLGDVALVGRWTALQKSRMKQSISLNFLAGVKLPTGDSDRIRSEVKKAEIFRALIGGSSHQHEFGGVHEHDLSLGSGSFDPITGLSFQARWDRWLFNTLAQYYWRTEGESSFTFGDELMISGGPGAFVLLDPKYTLSLQANAAYETKARDHFLGSKSNNTGSTAWHFGPQLTLTLGQHFSANAGVDIPLRIDNNGLQNVPEYRIHGGITWSF